MTWPVSDAILSETNGKKKIMGQQLCSSGQHRAVMNAVYDRDQVLRIPRLVIIPTIKLREIIDVIRAVSPTFAQRVSKATPDFSTYTFFKNLFVGSWIDDKEGRHCHFHRSSSPISEHFKIRNLSDADEIAISADLWVPIQQLFLRIMTAIQQV